MEEFGWRSRFPMGTFLPVVREVVRQCPSIASRFFLSEPESRHWIRAVWFPEAYPKAGGCSSRKPPDVKTWNAMARVEAEARAEMDAILKVLEEGKALPLPDLAAWLSENEGIASWEEFQKLPAAAEIWNAFAVRLRFREGIVFFLTPPGNNRLSPYPSAEARNVVFFLLQAAWRTLAEGISPRSGETTVTSGHRFGKALILIVQLLVIGYVLALFFSLWRF